MKFSDVIRFGDDGDPVVTGTDVEIHLKSTNALLATVQTDANGRFVWTTSNNPGPVYFKCTVGSETIIHSTDAVMPVDGFDLSSLIPMAELFNPGVVYSYPDGLGNGLKVTPGTGMQVRVAPGASTARGVNHVHLAQSNVAIDAAPGSGSRTDSVFVRHYYASPNEGKTEVLYVAGASTVETDSAHTVGYYDVHLATVQVDAGVTSIASNKIVDKRAFANPQIGTAYIASHMLAPGLGYPNVYIVSYRGTTFTSMNSDAYKTLIDESIVLPSGGWSGGLTFGVGAYGGSTELEGALSRMTFGGTTNTQTSFAAGGEGTAPIVTQLPVINITGTVNLKFEFHPGKPTSGLTGLQNSYVYGTLIRTS
jgi:hypothetical protein